MKLNIKKRDVFFFLLGVITMFLIEVFWNWEAHANAFKDGYNSVSYTTGESIDF